MTCKDTIKEDLFFEEIKRLSVSLEQGRFGARGNTLHFTDCRRDVLERVNAVLERFEVSVTTLGKLINRIAVGDIPNRIHEDLPHEFSWITKNLNLLIHRMNEIAVSSVLISSGTIDNLEIKELSSNDRIVRAFNLMVLRLRELLAEIDALISGIKHGNLNVRGDTSRFSGVWKDLVVTVNELMEQLLKSFEQTQQSEEKFKNIFESAPDGIFITGFDGSVIAFNQAAMQLFRYTDSEAFSKLNAERFYHDPMTDRPRLLEKLKGEGAVKNQIVRFKRQNLDVFSGSISMRIISFNGKECIQSIVRDITRIIAMEEKLRDYADNLEVMVEEQTRHLEKTNKELSEAVASLEETREHLAKQSFEAGMAEMAVSVLHNIGNAITPVNIRIGSMLDAGTVPGEVLRGLDVLNSIMEAGTALEGDRYHTVRKLIGSISRTLSDLNTATAGNLAFIQKNVEHIKEIISRQQRYAGVYGVTTSVNVNDLIDDTIEMLKDSMVKRKIEIHVNKENLPEISLDKNKMIQIFVNIVKNAYEAIEMAEGVGEREITLSTGRIVEKGVAMVRITCRDTGAGLTDEMKSRVFSFNFSTKKRVSGFGLHDCANYLRARGGDIRLESLGLNCGTTVTVDLPYSGKDT